MSSVARFDPVERACADDRQWFDRHPGATVRHRDAVPGEWPAFRSDDAQPADDVVVRVRVTLLGPGLRLRWPYLLTAPAATP